MKFKNIFIVLMIFIILAMPVSALSFGDIIDNLFSNSGKNMELYHVNDQVLDSDNPDTSDCNNGLLKIFRDDYGYNPVVLTIYDFEDDLLEGGNDWTINNAYFAFKTAYFYGSAEKDWVLTWCNYESGSDTCMSRNEHFDADKDCIVVGSYSSTENEWFVFDVKGMIIDRMSNPSYYGEQAGFLFYLDSGKDLCSKDVIGKGSCNPIPDGRIKRVKKPLFNFLTIFDFNLPIGNSESSIIINEPNDKGGEWTQELWGEQAGQSYPYFEMDWDYSQECNPYGACCDDDGQFLPYSHTCQTFHDYECEGDEFGDDVLEKTSEQKCTGHDEICNGDIIQGDWEIYEDCLDIEICQNSGSTYFCDYVDEYYNQCYESEGVDGDVYWYNSNWERGIMKEGCSGESHCENINSESAFCNLPSGE